MSHCQPGRVPLALSWAEGVRYTSWPITQGIPFADGVLARGTPARVVDSTGRYYPTQTRCLTTWAADQRFVRWLLIDFQVDLPAPAGTGFFLEYGPEAVSPLPDAPLALERHQDGVTVDTGALRLTAGPPAPPWLTPVDRPLFDRWQVRAPVAAGGGWQDLLTRSPYLYMQDQHGTLYRSDGPGPAHTLEVEEEGPLRACLCLRGYLATAAGVRFCPWVLRVHLFAGAADLRLHHTFVFDQEPHAVSLTAIGLALPLALGRRQRAAVGGEAASLSGPPSAVSPAVDTPARPPHAATRWQSLRLFQRDDQTYEVAHDGQVSAVAGRAAGWASLRGTHGTCVAVMGDFWQQYPKGFTLRPGELGLDIWPSAAGPLCFTTPFEEPAIYFGGTRDEATFAQLVAERPTAPLNLKSLDVQSPADVEWTETMVARYAPDRAVSHNDTGTENGTGAARTTDVLLRLRSEAIDDGEADGLARAAQEPPIAPASPAVACATGAFGPFHAAGDPRFAAVDAGLDFLLESVAQEPVERCRLYGMMRFGNMVCSHSAGSAAVYAYHRERHPGLALRHVGPYNNETNDQIQAVWGNFLRTGRRDHYRLAQRYGRTVADVAIIHAHPTRPAAVGLMHYHACHVWAGGPSASHTLLAGLALDYYLSGNRRLLDVMQEVADNAVRHQEPAGIISNRRGTLHRELLGPLWCVMEAYQATWSEAYGTLARRTLNWFLRSLPAPGQYAVSVYTRGERGDEAWVDATAEPAGHARDLVNLYRDALRLFPSDTLRRHIIAEADFFTDQFLTDNFVTADMARRLLTPRSKVWGVGDGWYWTQWGAAGNADGAIVGLAYELTGDLRYAAYASDHLDGSFRRQVARCRRYADWRFTWIGFGTYIPRLMQLVAQAQDRDPAALAAALQGWRDRRQQLGNPVYMGDGVDLDRDVMDTTGNILNRPPDELPREAPPRPQVAPHSLGVLATDDVP